MINHLKTKSDIVVIPELQCHKTPKRLLVRYKKRHRLIYNSIDSKEKELVLFRLINSKLLSKNNEHNRNLSEENLKNQLKDNKIPAFNQFSSFNFVPKVANSTNSPIHLYPDFHSFASPHLKRIRKDRLTIKKTAKTPSVDSALIIRKKIILPSVSSRAQL
jgi:hypothetical protein